MIDISYKRLENCRLEKIYHFYDGFKSMYLNVYIINTCTMLSKESIINNFMYIKKVKHRICVLQKLMNALNLSLATNYFEQYLRQTCCKYNNFINFTHFFQKFINMRAFCYVNLIIIKTRSKQLSRSSNGDAYLINVSFDFNRNQKIIFIDWLKGTVDQSFI